MADTRKRLTDVRAELIRLRADLVVLDAQLAHLRDVADEESLRAVVADSPLGTRERSLAADDLRRATRQREELAARIGTLTAEQDELLERL